jgi:hypothetical protein
MMGGILFALGAFGLFVLDIYSLYLVLIQYGLSWALAAFFIVPLQVFVPFLVGTWPYALIALAVMILGNYLNEK